MRIGMKRSVHDCGSDEEQADAVGLEVAALPGVDHGAALLLVQAAVDEPRADVRRHCARQTGRAAALRPSTGSPGRGSGRPQRRPVGVRAAPVLDAQDEEVMQSLALGGRGGDASVAEAHVERKRCLAETAVEDEPFPLLEVAAGRAPSGSASVHVGGIDVPRVVPQRVAAGGGRLVVFRVRPAGRRRPTRCGRRVSAAASRPERPGRDRRRLRVPLRPEPGWKSTSTFTFITSRV